jgi:hypothetical protein
MTLFNSSIWSCGLIWELKHNLILINNKMLTYSNAKCSKPCLPFEPHESPGYACGVLTLVYFSILWKNLGWVPDCQRLVQTGLWSTSQLSLWSGVFTWRPELSFRCLLCKVISFAISTLYIKHCHLILPLFVAICEIWLPRLTYGVYLVLFLKPGATTSQFVIHIHLLACTTHIPILLSATHGRLEYG